MRLSFFSYVTISFALLSSLGAAERRTQLNDHWGVFGDFVYMRRSHSSNKPLAVNPRKVRPGCVCDFTVLSTKDLINDMWFEPGYRAGLIYRPNARASFEANFLYLQPWSARGKKKSHDGTLLYPFTIGKRNTKLTLDNDPAIQSGMAATQDYANANKVKAKYGAHFWDAELNYWLHANPRWVTYFSFSGIFGFRYFHYNEDLKDTFYKNPSTDSPTGSHSDYKIGTKNNAYGVQIGANFQINPLPYFSWEFAAKFGFMYDQAKQKTLLRDEDNTVTLWNHHRKKWQNGVFGDAMAMLEFCFLKHINIHAGYQFLYLSGIATAEDQLVRRVTNNAGKAIRTHGVAMIHGAFVGMMISF